MPQISVIIPVYKVEPYIHRCIDSILAQTFSDFELILVDDGSPDNCGVICDEYAEKDSRIHVIHQKNGGLSAARNAGIDWAFANSDSRWLTFVDSDDWVHSEYLQRLYDAAAENDVAISICGYVETDGAVSELADDTLVPQLCRPCDFYIEHSVNAIIAWAKLYLKECFRRIRYPVGKIHEDEFVTYRILFEQKHISWIAAPLYNYYINLQGITKSEWSPKRLDAIEALQQQAVFFQKIGHQKAKERSIRLYAVSLLWQYDKYLESGLRSSGNDRKFQKMAQYFAVRYLKEVALDTERKVHLFWMAFPGAAKVYRSIKNLFRK